VRSLRPWGVAGTFMMIVALHATYALLISPQFSYMGYHYMNPDWGIYGLVVAMLLGVAALLPEWLRQPSDFALWLIFMSTVLPICVIGELIGELTPASAFMLALWVCLSFLAALGIVNATNGWRPHVSFSLPPRLFWGGLAVFIVATFGLLAVFTGVRRPLLGLMGIYSLRASYKSGLANFPLLGYMIPSLAYIVIPIVLVKGLHRRKWGLVLLAAALQYYLYTQTAFKTFVLALPVLVLMAVLIGRKVATLTFPWFMALAIFGASVLDLIFGTILISSLFTRRFLSTPGELTANYIAFFGEHPLVRLSDSVMSGFYHYPYSLPVPFVIGQYILHVTTNSANANLFADGYAQFSWPGVLAAGIILGFVLAALNAASRGLPVTVPAILMLLPCIILGNASILTALLTHGLVVGIVVLALAPRTGWEPDAKKPRRRNLLI